MFGVKKEVVAGTRGSWENFTIHTFFSRITVRQPVYVWRIGWETLKIHNVEDMRVR
jgi:hypothetical protein